MRVQVLFFASWAELTGSPSAEIDLAEGSRVDDVLAELCDRWPAIEKLVPYVAVAINQAYADRGTVLADGDEVAVIPPVSGGESVPSLVTISSESLDPREIEASVVRPEYGAICTFSGLTRNNHEGRSVLRLEYEAYVPMATTEMERLVEEARNRWDLGRVAIAHRVGIVPVGEPSVVISVSAVHRKEAFAACRNLIDRIKESVPIWKKEEYEDGSSWIEGEHRRGAGD